MTARERPNPRRPKESHRPQRERFNTQTFSPAHRGSKWLLLPGVKDNPVKPCLCGEASELQWPGENNPSGLRWLDANQVHTTVICDPVSWCSASLWAENNNNSATSNYFSFWDFQHFWINRQMSVFCFFLQGLSQSKCHGGLQVYTFHVALKIAAVSHTTP